MTKPDDKLTAGEWRLYIIAVFAALYVIAWRVISPPAKPAIVQPVGPVEAVHPIAPAPRTAIWIDELPADQRPLIIPPAGWTAVRSDAAVPRIAPVTRTRQPVRVPAKRRARTRSS